MSQKAFRFRTFQIEQPQAAMKVGTDSLLLGAWTSLDGTELNALDVGTGTGVLALMLASRSSQLRLGAIDVEEGAVADARNNVASSPYAHQIEVRQEAWQQLTQGEQQYDLIISNPPYFLGGPKNQSVEKLLARHQSSLGLSLAELIMPLYRCLTPRGKCSLVLPIEVWEQAKLLAVSSKLCLERVCYVSSFPEGAPIRVLSLWRRLSLSEGYQRPQSEYLAIYDAPGRHSAAYRALLSEHLPSVG